MIISRNKHRSTIEVCADCGASDPSWASINRGLLLCAECCSVHRSMGRHISHVKSLRQGTWPPSLLAMIQACTAQNVNSIWEHSLLDTSAPKHLRKKPQPKDPLHPTKSEFILAKHLRLAYVLRARRDEPAGELARQLHSAVRSASLDTAMRLLAQGADPNYYSHEKGTSCLHVAARAGQAAQAELLVAWGAAPAARDNAGNTPAHCARQGGHTSLAERMTELVYEATDRLVFFLTGERPPHVAGAHYVLPDKHDNHEMTDVAKAARGKLQLLPNHLFEELVMDIYDEIDRRETEAIWQTSACGLERSGVAFLPVNPALSAPRNQGRQKLARLSGAELAALLRDVLADAARRHHMATLHPRVTGPLNPLLSASHLKHISQMSDDEPLYDSVASDEDYAHLTPIDLEISSVTPRPDEPVSSFLPSLSERSSLDRRTQTTTASFADKDELETLKKELHTKDSTINDLKNQLKNLQTIVEQLTKENSVLKTNSIDDDNSMTSQLSMNDSCLSNVLDGVKIQERGRSLETEELTRADFPEDAGAADHADGAGAAGPARPQRPVSMFEAREGPRNNWQVTKHQGGRTARSAWGEAALQARAERVTRAITALWAAARGHDPLDAPREDLNAALAHLFDLFPQPLAEPALSPILSSLRGAEAALAGACRAGELQAVRAAAYDLAKGTKLLVTHFHPNS